MRARILKGKLWIFVIAAALLILPSLSVALPKASALVMGGCAIPPYTQVWYGRAWGCGFFTNRYETQPGGNGSLVPGGVTEIDNVQGFINLVLCGVFSGGIPGWATAGVPQDAGGVNCSPYPMNYRAYVVSVFYVLTMQGIGPAGNDAPGPPMSVSQGELTQWEADLEGGYTSQENGTTSSGPSGTIYWHLNQPESNCGVGTTYYQWNGTNDVGIYVNTVQGAPPTGCGPNWQSIEFTSGPYAPYIIESACGNTTESAGRIPTYTPNFSLAPVVTASVNGGSTGAVVAEVGDTITYDYYVNNGGTTATTGWPIGCSFYTYNDTYNPSPGVGNPDGAPPGCPSVYGTGQTYLGSETVTVASAEQGHSICRSLVVNPSSYGGGPSAPAEACVVVAYEPYLKVFGGDVSAGAGLDTAPSVCTTNTDAAITSWNQQALNGYSGAGTQYAAYALDIINDFATAQNNAGSSTPTGLSFANTSTNVGGGNFGGNFGSSDCIPNYYSTKPASTQPLLSSVNTMTTGAYSGSGTINFNGGTVQPGQRISVYVNGNVYINNNIVYGGSGWSLNNIPLFQLIVQGNIYIGSNVSRLDGVYIAQEQSDGSGGVIYTCSTWSGGVPSVPSTANGAFYDTCNNKLTVNGAVVANSVEFLRTAGSLSNSSPGETSDVNGNGNNAAEVFNFNPAVWLAQPVTNSIVNGYDSITSLPPIL